MPRRRVRLLESTVKDLQEYANRLQSLQPLASDARLRAVWAIQLCRNFTSYKAVLLTMAADACAISNDYTRECDREDMDVAQLNLRAQRFICSARALFVEHKVCTLPSFTKDLLLRREPVTVPQDGFALEVRVTQADLDKAFAVMEDIRCQPVFIVQNMFFFVHQIPP